jgi:hypothetical protein
MQVNNTLSVSRFGAYFKKHLVDNYRFYLMSVVVLAGLLLLLLAFAGIDKAPFSKYSDLLPFYLIGLYVVGFIFTSMSFSELGNKSRGIDYLMLPASNFEKFLVTLLITTIGFLLVYHLAFFLAAKIMAGIMAMSTGKHLENDLNHYSDRYLLYLNAYLWVIAQSIFFLGAVYFHKYSLIKTGFFFILFVLFLYLIHTVFVQILFHKQITDWREHFPFIGINTITTGTYTIEGDPVIHHNRVMLSLTEKPRNVFLFIGKYLVAPMLWTVAYFRLRDKEI